MSTGGVQTDSTECCAGLGATLARDVPFSAVYWGALEPIRNSIIPAGPDASPPSRVAVANLASGAIGGAIASALTQPLVRPPLLLQASTWPFANENPCFGLVHGILITELDSAWMASNGDACTHNTSCAGLGLNFGRP